jgi:hypothetical protein
VRNAWVSVFSAFGLLIVMLATPVILILLARGDAPAASERTSVEQSRAEKADAVTRALAALEEFTRSYGASAIPEQGESLKLPLAADMEATAPAKDVVELIPPEQARMPDRQATRDETASLAIAAAREELERPSTNTDGDLARLSRADTLVAFPGLVPARVKPLRISDRPRARRSSAPSPHAWRKRTVSRPQPAKKVTARLGSSNAPRPAYRAYVAPPLPAYRPQLSSPRQASRRHSLP